jgi:hypothetical protein
MNKIHESQTEKEREKRYTQVQSEMETERRCPASNINEMYEDLYTTTARR